VSAEVGIALYLMTFDNSTMHEEALVVFIPAAIGILLQERSKIVLGILFNPR
jgi:hypothetical protein